MLSVPMIKRLFQAVSPKWTAVSYSLVRSLSISRSTEVDLDFRSEPFCQKPGVRPKWSSAEDAFTDLQNGSKIFVQGAASTPTLLLEELFKYVTSRRLEGIELYHLFTLGSYPFFKPGFENCFSSRSLFVGSNCREAVNAGVADFYPIFLSEIPLLFQRKIIEFDLALISVSPPDKHGYCSLGTSVDITRSAIQNAKKIIGQVNPNVPVTCGDANVHTSHFDYFVYGAAPLHETLNPESSVEEMQIGKMIAENLVDDGCTIEAGIGSIPQSIFGHLIHHKDLGIHTEMFSDSLVDLVSVGAVTNACKRFRPGKILASFVIGTRKVFDFIDHNPLIDMSDIRFVASAERIAQNPKPTCINTCLAIDLTGQVASDSIGNYIYSGIGGIVDFMRGAAISVDGKGKPILGLTSRTKQGKPKIVPMLEAGTGVVVTRAHTHYVVTEYGMAYLFGRNLRQRAHALIQIAHPDDREYLEKAAFESLRTMPSPD